MSFIADKQTLEDLNLHGRYKSNSIFYLFNKTITDGGRQMLEDMFRAPLTDPEQINERVRGFQYFSKHPLQLPFTGEEFAVMENYLRSTSNSQLETFCNTANKKIRSKLTASEAFSQLETGFKQTIKILQAFRDLVMPLPTNDNQAAAGFISTVKEFFQSPLLKWLHEINSSSRFSLLHLSKYDHCLRGKMQKEMKTLMEIIWWFDVNISVSSVASAKGFCFPEALPAAENQISIEGLYHPMLAKAVSNAAAFTAAHNVIFLTGANMAGKSTYMKSFGVAVYLAHMGFPVAATDMRFSVKEGLFSSINVPDDLEHGYSHFYAEVLRVKTVAQAVDSGKNLVVIFDELFKGTNVKDAYEATLSITEAFSKHRNCCFIVSTHIIEVGHALQEQTQNIRFLYMPTIMQGNIPTYTYKMKEGITADRQGMMIIENEKILELIKQV